MDYKARIQELRKILEYNSKLYYDMDAPVMSDYEYDHLLRELEDLEAREAYINECLDTLHGIEIDSRVLKDADYLTKSGFGAITAAEGKLGRQLNGWSNSTLKKLGKQTDNK